MEDTGNNYQSTHANWKQFQQLFENHFPFVQPVHVHDIPNIEQYIRNTLDGAFQQLKRNPDTNIRSEMIETHHHVIAKFYIPADMDPNNILVFISGNHIKLEVLPKRNKQLFKIPSMVQPRSGRALYKNGILQVKIRKHPIEEQYHEVDILYR